MIILDCKEFAEIYFDQYLSVKKLQNDQKIHFLSFMSIYCNKNMSYINQVQREIVFSLCEWFDNFCTMLYITEVLEILLSTCCSLNKERLFR